MKLCFEWMILDKHSCRIQEDANPQSVIERSLYSKKVTIWCDFSTSWPLLFENEKGETVTVTVR